MQIGSPPSGSASNQGRLTELDAMRGIAAFSVVLSHACDNLALRQLPVFQVLGATPLRAMTSGRHGVIFFFVLSGLVLTRALLAGPSPGFLIFALRRVVRLCLPAGAALIFSASLYALCHAPGAWLDPNAWMGATSWTRAPTFVGIGRQTLLIGVEGDFDLDPPLWTLAHELRLSLLLPLVVSLAIRWRSRGGTLLLAACGALFGAEIGDHLITSDSGAPHSLILTSIYLALPAVIVALLASRMTPSRWLPGVVAGWRIAAVCAIAGAAEGALVGHGGRITLGYSAPETLLATAYFAPCFLIGAALSLGALDRLPTGKEHRIPCLGGAMLLLCSDDLFAISVASVLLILVARLPGRLRGLLRSPPLVFLGRVSFSLYLVHVPLLVGLSHALHDVMPKSAITGLAVVLAIPAAWVLYLAAERPAQRLARRIALPAKVVPA